MEPGIESCELQKNVSSKTWDAPTAPPLLKPSKSKGDGNSSPNSLDKDANLAFLFSPRISALRNKPKSKDGFGQMFEAPY